MRTLDRKLLRDLRRLWAQALAIALVVAGGVVTVVMAVGSMRSLDETRIAYYERYRFADVFASVRRAPKTLIARVEEIPGVAEVEPRIATLALLDIPGFSEPATGMLISIPKIGEPRLNRLYIRSGRMPEAGRINEVAVSEGFAREHGFELGAHFSAILNGRKTELTVVGAALSPEFVYTIGPGDIMPDERRFAVIWMPEQALAAAYNLEGGFSSVTLKLLRNASVDEAIGRLDRLLEPYGGTAAIGRKDQMSHAFLEHGLDMLRNMGSTLPPIFFLVTVFLVNLTLSRIVTLEREQIGLLKALGHGTATIASHYVKFVMTIAAVGVVIGSAVGTWLGIYVTELFSDYYRFPFLIFVLSPDVYVLAALLSLAAAVAGAGRAIRTTVRLPPAVAMHLDFHRPPARRAIAHRRGSERPVPAGGAARVSRGDRSLAAAGGVLVPDCHRVDRQALSRSGAPHHDGIMVPAAATYLHQASDYRRRGHRPAELGGRDVGGFDPVGSVARSRLDRQHADRLSRFCIAEMRAWRQTRDRRHDQDQRRDRARMGRVLKMDSDVIARVDAMWDRLKEDLNWVANESAA